MVGAMITFQLSKEQMDKVESNLALCKAIAESGEQTLTENDLAFAYTDLVQAIAQGVLADGQMIMVGREERLGDSIDRPSMHNVNIANRPSAMQEKAYEDEHKDDVVKFTDPTKDEECKGWMK
jgi:hypothetical protein